MNNNPGVSRRYAQALLMLATEHKLIDKFQEELEAVLQVLATENKLYIALLDPRLQPQEKKELLNKQLVGKVSPLIENFLNVIIDKKREDYLPQIIQQYFKYADETRGIVEAQVYSVVSLTDKDFHKLEKRLAKVSGKKIRLKNIVDPSLLGGLVIKIGETVIDGSIVKRLALLKEYLQKQQLNGLEVKKT